MVSTNCLNPNTFSYMFPLTFSLSFFCLCCHVASYALSFFTLSVKSQVVIIPSFICELVLYNDQEL